MPVATLWKFLCVNNNDDSEYFSETCVSAYVSFVFATAAGFKSHKLYKQHLRGMAERCESLYIAEVQIINIYV